MDRTRRDRVGPSDRAGGIQRPGSRSGRGRIAFSRFDVGGRRNIWVYDLARGDERPITFDGDSSAPLWSPDSESVVFTSARGRGPNLFREVLTKGTEERLTESARVQIPQSWDASGDGIVYLQVDPESGRDLWRLSVEDGHAESLALNTAFDDYAGQVSPNGRWIAYASNQSGRQEVIVAGFPTGPPRPTISVTGGSHPEWRADGEELYYISQDDELMAVDVAVTETGFEAGTPRRLFSVRGRIDTSSRGEIDIYAPASDGQRFLFLLRTENLVVPPLRVIVNWPSLMNR